MHIISGSRQNLSDGLYEELAAYRYQVFVEHLGWQLDTIPGHEADQFDRDDTVYVVARHNDGKISGCARLLPTCRPYLLGEVFPELLNGLPAPHSPAIWELSRFTAFDSNGQVKHGAGQFSSPVAVSLLGESIATAARMGAQRLITVSPVGVERLLRRAGFHAHRAGPPMILGGHPLFACWIEVADASALVTSTMRIQ